MELNFVLCIQDRAKEERFRPLLEGIPLVLTMLGHGTATGEHLNMYGLRATEKTTFAFVADAERTRKIIRDARRKLYIDVPGNGIIVSIPIKSVGGRRTMSYLTDNAPVNGAAPEMRFEYEMILAVMKEGYNEAVMNAARSAGASGGTVLHAKGTGKRFVEKFLDVSLANEKEVLLIVARAEEKADIMRAILTQTDAEAIVFSLPVSDVAGIGGLDSEDEAE